VGVLPFLGAFVGDVTGRFVGAFVRGFAGAFVGGFTGCFVGACVGSLTGAFVGRIAGAFVGLPATGSLKTVGFAVGGGRTRSIAMSSKRKLDDSLVEKPADLATPTKGTVKLFQTRNVPGGSSQDSPLPTQIAGIGTLSRVFPVMSGPSKTVTSIDVYWKESLVKPARTVTKD
jgi:hypothetical protein